MNDKARHRLDDAAAAFHAQRISAERALEQIDDTNLFRTLAGSENSIAVLMKHIGGNLRSRWTEPFTTDGEKQDRDRDREFEVDADTAASVKATWDRGWAALERTLAEAADDDLQRTLTIRGEPLPLSTALYRSLAHTAQHVGQIILLAKHWRGAEWRTISIPKRTEQP